MAQSCCWAVGTNRASERIFDGLGFGGARYYGVDPLRCYQGGDGHGESVGGHTVEICEATVVHLLHAACFVQLHHFHFQRVRKVRHRWVVESQVPILPDASADDVNRMRFKQGSVALALLLWIRSLAIQIVHGTWLDRLK